MTTLHDNELKLIMNRENNIYICTGHYLLSVVQIHLHQLPPRSWMRF